MTLTNIYMQNVNVKPKQEVVQTIETAKTSKEYDKFDSYLSSVEKNYQNNNKAENAVKNDKIKNIDKKQSNNLRTENKITDKDISNEKVAGNDKKASAINDKKTESSKEISAQEYSEEDFDKAGKELIENLAKELGISVEMIQQILISMNVKPLELQNDVSLNEFIQKLEGVSSAQELLNIPDIKDVMDKASLVIEEYKDIANEFIQKLLDDEIGKPKFVDAGDKEHPKIIFTSIQPKSNEDVGTIESNMSENRDEAEAITEVSDDSNTESNILDNIIKTDLTDEAQNQGFGASAESEQDNSTSLENQEQTITPVTLNATSPTHIEFEKAELKNESVKNINTEDVVNQIVEKIKVEAKTDGTEIKVSLRPEHLGDVTLKIKTQNGIVTAQFVAENQKVKEIIESGFSSLKETLQQQGINISQLSVSVGQENADSQMEQFVLNQEKSSRRINQIINNISAEEAGELANSYANDRQVYDNNVDYKA